MSNPILVEVIRGGVVESRHRGAMIAFNAQGETLLSMGDVEALVYPRSSLKLFQALPLIESGGADALGLSDKQIALSCASHSGEQMHVDAVSAWLNQLGLDEQALECGSTLPLEEPVLRAHIRAGGDGSKTHNNCSGKHAGMLSLATHLGQGIKGYSTYEHPVTQTWLKVMSELSGVNMQEMVWERDGCGMPAPQMPLSAFAKGMAQFAAPENHAPKRAAAIKRVLACMGKYPEMMAGTHRCCTAVIRQTKGEVIVKTGAEGVFGGVAPNLGIGFALKIDDGATRASEVALGGLLNQLELISQAKSEALSGFFEPKLMNSQGWQTGVIRAAIYGFDK
ncbi:MAG: asparaginase [Arenicellales bacterium]